MRPHTCLRAEHFASFSSLLSASFGRRSTQNRPARHHRRSLAKLFFALVMALVLLPLTQVELFAQQGYWPGSQYSPYAQQSPSQHSPYSSQYATSQQPGYGYARPQPYAQQPSPQQPYAQQTEAGPPYAYLDQTDQQPGYAQPQPTQAFTAQQLEQMLAPIALYPDALLAQILAAATYPAQVSIANQWLRVQGNASPEQIAASANAQDWDPSVKALTAFPQVLAQMDQDLAWTTDLGNAYFNQPQDVLQTVQVLRQRAHQAGNLQNTPQEQVTYDQGNIELAPPDPNTVYVPSYNPWNVYGNPIQPYPGFSLLNTLGSFFGSSPIQYGLGVAMAAFTHTPFGWLSWALDWLGNSVLFNHSTYYSQSTSVSHWGYGRSGYGGRDWAARGRGAYGYGHDSRFDQHRGEYDRQQDYASGYGYNGFGSRDWNRGYSPRPGYQPGYHGNYGHQNSYGRPAFQDYAYNRFSERPQQSFVQRSYAGQSYVRPAFGSSYYGGSNSNRDSRPGGFSSIPQQNWRAPSTPSHGWFGQRGNSSQRSFSPPHSGFFGRGNSGYSPKPERSGGGFHLFGGGRGSSHSFSAPHSFGGGKAPKGFGGGGHGGGGHSSGHGGWGHHH